VTKRQKPLPPELRGPYGSDRKSARTERPLHDAHETDTPAHMQYW